MRYIFDIKLTKTTNMKKIILSTAILAVTLVSIAQRKADTEFKNIVKFNPLGLLLGNANLSYEYVLTEKSAAQLNVQFGARSAGTTKYTFVGAGVDYKFYLSHTKAAPKGFYASPGAGFYSITVKDGTQKYNGSGAILKGTIGNQWVWGSGFALDVFGGVNYFAGSRIKGAGSVEYNVFSGLLPSIGVSLGYAF